MILALDIALNTGFAYGTGDDIKFGSRSFEGLTGDDARLGRKFNAWLEGIFQQVKPSILVIERPFLRHQGPTRLLYGLVWEAHRVAEWSCVDRVEYAPISIKKFICGSGKAQKSDMIRAIRKIGYKVNNDDESDAVALLLFHQKGNP